MEKHEVEYARIAQMIYEFLWQFEHGAGGFVCEPTLLCGKLLFGSVDHTYEH